MEVVGVSRVALVREGDKVGELFPGFLVKQRHAAPVVDAKTEKPVFEQRFGGRSGRSRQRGLVALNAVDANARRRKFLRRKVDFEAKRWNLTGQVDRRIVGLRPVFHGAEGETHRLPRRIGDADR
ncbi:hypothetical protein SDC9_170265 [bioreactor metagenome]|uniref:Uncharacterized protein n=1 Tax=bioreactor metagenome TaxID=1076179 RepID=A0A645GA21_9ZZZZ